MHLKENGASANSNVKIREWAEYSWIDWSPGNTIHRYLSLEEDNILKDSIFSSFGQKFIRWETISPAINYYTNFAGIIVGDNTNDINVYHKGYNGTTFNLVSEIPTLLKMQFKDPWVVKTAPAYYQSPIGYKNLGLNAVYENVDNGGYSPILLNQNPNFLPNIPNYSISIPSSIHLTQTGKTHNLYLQSWSYSGATLQNPNSLNTGVVFTSSSSSLTANVKATQISDNTNSFTQNGQRKIIRTPDSYNTMHMVYESMGHVWYETSRDNGATWTMMNSGHPIDNGGGKCPSIDFIKLESDEIVVVIIYQEPRDGFFSNIIAKVYKGYVNYIDYQKIVVDYANDLYEYNDNPVLSIDSYGFIIIVWENSGLYYRYGGISSNGLTLIGNNATFLSGTTSYSKNPAIASCKIENSTEIAHLVWEENNTIKYYTFNSAPPGTIQTISTGSYSYNYSPSVIAGADGYARICWRGRYNLGSNSRVIFRSSNYNHFWYFGSNIRTPQITLADDNSNYFVMWNEASNNSTKFTDSQTLSNIYDLGCTGQAIQLSNGANKNYMYALVYNNQAQPYFFKTSPSVGSKYGLQKSNNASLLNAGRGAVVVKDTIGFYFMLHNLDVDNQSIEFIKATDSTVIDNISELNEYLISQPFAITDNSSFNFEVSYGISIPNAETASNILNGDNAVTYSLDLVDAESGKTLGNIEKLVFDKDNLPLNEGNAFKVNLEGMDGSKNVYLKIKAENNFGGKCLLTESYSDLESESFAKTNIKEINYKDLLVVKEYVLVQNYPNPFNPTTTINYQIPKDGFVTLKIYDVLGREVAVLVNENKSTGRYNINFNAGNLASGAYLYQLKVNDFVSTKKLVLLK